MTHALRGVGGGIGDLGEVGGGAKQAQRTTAELLISFKDQMELRS